jgi:hypothetical protein
MSSVSNNAPARVRLFSMELEASKIGQVLRILAGIPPDYFIMRFMG